MRVFLVLIAFVLATLPLTGTAQHNLPATGDQPGFSFEEAMGMALRYDRILDTIPEDTFASITTNDDVRQWTHEIVPFFGYEGITGPDAAEFTTDLWGGYVYPTSQEWKFYDDMGSQGHHHIGGTANCMSGEMWLNARYANPVSSSYDSRAVLAILVHELAHIQGICFHEYAEQHAQMVTLEILAAMAMRGNEAAFASLILEMRDMYLDAALALALFEDRLQSYEYIVFGSIHESAQARAAFDKTLRYWDHDPVKLMEILIRYNLDPMSIIDVSFLIEGCTYTNIRWDTDVDDLVEEEFHLPVDCVQDVRLPINMDVFTLPLIIDDLSYINDHAEELAEELE